MELLNTNPMGNEQLHIDDTTNGGTGFPSGITDDTANNTNGLTSDISLPSGNSLPFPLPLPLFLDHTTTDATDSNSNFNCGHCSYTAMDKANLRRHVNTVHLKVKNFKCDECDFKASTGYRLEQHVKSIHRNIWEYQCDKCPYKSDQKPNLEKHVRAIHDKVKEYTCDFCPFKATIKSNRDRHVKTVHQKIRDFGCPQCPYKSSTQADIKKHIKLRHQKVREFLCDECGYRGSVRGDVIKHKNAVHKGIKPFQCGFCQYRASYKHSLKQHIFNRHKNAKVDDEFFKPKNNGYLKKYLTTAGDENCAEANPAVSVNSPNGSTSEKNSSCNEDDLLSDINSAPNQTLSEVSVKVPAVQGSAVSFMDAMAVTDLDHLINDASVNLVFKCDECAYQTSSVESFDDHMRSVHAPNAYMCSQCEFKASIQEELEKHMNTTHVSAMEIEPDTTEHSSTPEKVSCNAREYTAPAKEDLDIHVKSTHSTEKVSQQSMATLLLSKTVSKSSPRKSNEKPKQALANMHQAPQIDHVSQQQRNSPLLDNTSNSAKYDISPKQGAVNTCPDQKVIHAIQQPLTTYPHTDTASKEFPNEITGKQTLMNLQEPREDDVIQQPLTGPSNITTRSKPDSNDNNTKPQEAHEDNVTQQPLSGPSNIISSSNKPSSNDNNTKLHEVHEDNVIQQPLSGPSNIISSSNKPSSNDNNAKTTSENTNDDDIQVVQIIQKQLARPVFVSSASNSALKSIKSKQMDAISQANTPSEAPHVVKVIDEQFTKLLRPGNEIKSSPSVNNAKQTSDISHVVKVSDQRFTRLLHAVTSSKSSPSVNNAKQSPEARHVVKVSDQQFTRLLHADTEIKPSPTVNNAKQTPDAPHVVKVSDQQFTRLLQAETKIKSSPSVNKAEQPLEAPHVVQDDNSSSNVNESKTPLVPQDIHGFYSCVECEFKASTQKGLDEHMISAQELHEDIQWRRSVRTITTVPVHEDADDAMEEGEVDDDAKTIHVITHPGHKMAKSHACDQCSYRAKRRVMLERHYDSVHLSNKRFACSISGCHFRTARKDTIYRHEREKHKMLKRSYQCKICAYKVGTSDLLKIHMKAAHDMELEIEENDISESHVNVGQDTQIPQRVKKSRKWHQCKKCDFRAETKRVVNDHVYMAHIRPIRVESNAIDSVLECQANDHQESQFGCGQCDFIAETEKLLRDHVETLHEYEELSAFFDDSIDGSNVNSSIKMRDVNAEQNMIVMNVNVAVHEQNQFKTETKDLTTRHQNQFATNSQYYCEHCGFTTGTKDLLDGHTKAAHNIQEPLSNREVQSLIQGIKAESNNTSESSNNGQNGTPTNREQHNANTRRNMWRCTKCGHNAPTMFQLEKHIVAAHSNKDQHIVAAHPNKDQHIVAAHPNMNKHIVAAHPNMNKHIVASHPNNYKHIVAAHPNNDKHIIAAHPNKDKHIVAAAHPNKDTHFAAENPIEDEDPLAISQSDLLGASEGKSSPFDLQTSSRSNLSLQAVPSNSQSISKINLQAEPNSTQSIARRVLPIVQNQVHSNSMSNLQSTPNNSQSRPSSPMQETPNCNQQAVSNSTQLSSVPSSIQSNSRGIITVVKPTAMIRQHLIPNNLQARSMTNVQSASGSLQSNPRGTVTFLRPTSVISVSRPQMAASFRIQGKVISLVNGKPVDLQSSSSKTCALNTTPALRGQGAVSIMTPARPNALQSFSSSLASAHSSSSTVPTFQSTTQINQANAKAMSSTVHSFSSSPQIHQANAKTTSSTFESFSSTPQSFPLNVQPRSSESPRNPLNLCCNLCNVTLNDVSSLARHIQQVHEGINSKRSGSGNTNVQINLNDSQRPSNSRSILLNCTRISSTNPNIRANDPSNSFTNKEMRQSSNIGSSNKEQSTGEFRFATLKKERTDHSNVSHDSISESSVANDEEMIRNESIITDLEKDILEINELMTEIKAELY